MVVNVGEPASQAVSDFVVEDNTEEKGLLS